MAQEATARRLPGVDTAEVVRRAIHGKGRDPGGLVFSGLLLMALLAALAVLLVLLGQITSEGLPLLRERGASFLTDNISSLPQRAGIAQGIRGSVTIVVFVILFAFPLGIGAAIYLEEYAHDTRFTRIINANIRNLAGVPAIVYGLLGIAIFIKFQPLAGITGGRSVISAGLTISILVLPIVVITTAEAIRAVPYSIREAGFGVGATRWEVIRSHVLPYAAPGILTGTVLTIARAFGEAAPLVMIGAATGFLSTGSAGFVEQLQGPYTALPVQVYDFATRNLRVFSQHSAAAGMVLLAILLVVNGTAIYLRNRYERKW